MTKPLRLVVLNEDAEAAKRLADSLSTNDVVVYRVADPDEACELISLLQHDILLIDIEKLICTPVYPLQAFRQAKPDLKIVGISGGQRGDTGLLKELLGLDAYVRYPVTPEALIISVPEIADRYLMAPLDDNPDQDRDDHDRQKLRMRSIPFISTVQRP